MDRPVPGADTHQAIVDVATRGLPFALALVLEDQGHTPRKAATKALVDANGAIFGTIGGGAVEAEAQRRAVVAIRTGNAAVFEYALAGASTAAMEPICGGSMRVLIDPGVASQRAVYARAVAARRQRQAGVLATTVRHGAALQVAVEWFPAGTVPTPTPAPVAAALRARPANAAGAILVQHTEATGVRLETLVETLLPPPLLVIAGGGHIGQALAWQAALVGFEVLVIDDRPEFTATERFPDGVSTCCGDIAAELAARELDSDTYVVIVTRGHQHDEQALAACIRKPAAYLGMIGSRRKVALLRAALLAAGSASSADLDRVYAPIGLDLGAETVPEIAASILAQLITVRRKGSAPRLPSE